MWARRACSMSMVRQLPGARAQLARLRSAGALLLGRASLMCPGALCKARRLLGKEAASPTLAMTVYGGMQGL